MERMIKLNLSGDGEKAYTADFAKPKRAEAESPVISRRLNRIVNRVAHHAATRFGQSRSGIFTK